MSSSGEPESEDDPINCPEKTSEEKTAEQNNEEKQCSSNQAVSGTRRKNLMTCEEDKVSEDDESKYWLLEMNADHKRDDSGALSSVTKRAKISLAKINEEKHAETASSRKETGHDENRSTNSSDSDSDSDDEKKQSIPINIKTLKDLGITLNESNHVWKSPHELTTRQLGFIPSTLFTRNVTGSINMVERFKLERKLECHNGCVNTLNFNSSGDLLASGSDDLDVVVWDWAKGKKMFSYESGHIANVFQVCIASSYH